MRLGLAAISFVVLVIAATFVIFTNDDKANGAENAESFIRAIGERDADAAKDHVCEVRKPDVDRIISDLSTGFDGKEAAVTIETDTIECTDEADYITCTYNVTAKVLGEVTMETIEESYKTRNGLVCGLVTHDEEPENEATPAS